MLTSQPFKIPASTLAATIMKRWIGDHIVTLAMPPFILTFFGALFDLKILVVALMLVFVIIPPIMMIVYFYHAMSPTAAFSILRHSVSVDTSGLTFTYLPEENPVGQGIHDETKDSAIPAREPEHVSWDRIARIDETSASIVVTLNDSPYSIILIPRDAFDGQSDWVNFRSNIRSAGQIMR